MFSSIWTDLLNSLVVIINALISHFAGAVQGAVDLLPEMPEIPDPPSQLTDVEGWIAWVFPVQAMIDAIAFTSGVVALWWIVSLVLRWAHAERGNA